MPEKHRSRCQCGEVEMELEGAPIVSLNCHCKVCQQWCGAPFQWMVLYAGGKARVVKGENNMSFIQSSKTLRRARCKTCTSHVYNSKRDGLMYSIPGVTVEGIRNEDHTFAEGFAPSVEIFYGARVQDHNTGLPTFDGLPPTL